MSEFEAPASPAHTPDATAVPTPDARTVLRAAGLRITAMRLAVLDTLAAHPHATTDVVLGHVRERLGSASTQAVYDVLRVFGAHGVIRRIEPAGHPARYETRIGDNHHHVICRGCGRIADVDCAVGHTPCLTASDDHGFLIDEAEVTYWGLCPDCRASPQGP